MKKSARYIYPRVIPNRRFPWRRFGVLACAVVVAGLFFVHDDVLEIVRLFRSVSVLEAADAAGSSAGSPSGEFPAAVPSVAKLPAESVTPQQVAALAAAAEERPERPGMLLATLGDGISRLKSLPFFLPTSDPAEDSDAGDDGKDGLKNLFSGVVADMAEALEKENSGPVVYEENERYTVENGDDGLQIFHSVVTRGDTAGVILNEWISAGEVRSAVSAAESVFSLASIHEGRPFRIERVADTGEFVRFVYEMDNRRCLVLERQDGAFTAALQAIDYDTDLVKVTGNIRSSLFEAVADAGEGPVLAVNMAEVFSCEINFINEIREGDHFEVLVEKLYRDGQFKGYGAMLAARFVNQGRMYEAYLYPDASGRLRYYNAEGEALQKALLKAPLAFTRISSGYSMNRKHPVFGNSRPHQGVDYAAPTGTPIKAVGDGIVTRAGWGNGYGNMVVIKHSGGLESQYAHMSGFARGIKKGVRVRQGQTIGYVGATGVATGPHLDFRLKQNGSFINPTRVIVPRENPVDRKRMPDFQRSVALSRAYLDGDAALAEYSPVRWGE